ncbi:ECF-type sigma factor [Shewanella sp.]|uniref:ECF-type sigma factor n=1 Tax=Shewanella sp. TaxID=50422 RepID=UPI003A96D27B
MTEQEVLSLIHGWQQQDKHAMQLLMGITYQKLHHLSHEHRNRWLADADTELLSQTATDVAHEIYLKFEQAKPQMSIATVREFYQYLNSSVRNLYVDQFRRCNRLGRAEVLTQLFSERAIAQADHMIEHQLEYADLDGLLARFSERFPRQAEVMELRFFSLQSNKQIALLLDISLRTVENDIRFAKAWLKTKMQ